MPPDGRLAARDLLHARDARARRRQHLAGEQVGHHARQPLVVRQHLEHLPHARRLPSAR